MKSIIKYLAILLVAIGFAQNNSINEKLSYHSFSITPIEIFISSYAEGLSITGDLSYSINNNIISISGTIGEELTLLGRANRFKELSVFYGREYKIIDWFLIETHAGLGVLFFKDSDNLKETQLGMPLVSKLRFKTGEKFSLGIKLHANINSIDNIYSTGILLQWNHI